MISAIFLFPDDRDCEDAQVEDDAQGGRQREGRGRELTNHQNDSFFT